uniref:LigA n=1 Tax=Parastrongyloides trichosuri TaxID=131310 RepID=A0A0N4ZXN1_PARTI
MGGTSRRGRRHARGLRRRPGSGAGLLQPAATATGQRPPQRRAPGAGRSGGAVGGRFPAGDAERRRPARPGAHGHAARTGLRADPHARRAEEGALHRLRR